MSNNVFIPRLHISVAISVSEIKMMEDIGISEKKKKHIGHHYCRIFA